VTLVPSITPAPTNTPDPTPTPEPTNTPEPTPSPTAIPPEITDTKGVEMVLVPAGEFTMGNDAGDDDEHPVHQVFLDAYFIDKYEVTNALYKVCVEAGVCDQPTDTDDYNNSQYLQHPVVYVDWNMAQQYCEWRDARLPTEAEWEKAASGTDGSTYPWGDEEIDNTFANFSGSETNSVGSYPKGVSPYGAYDMAGNVWEWVADWYDSYPGSTVSDSHYGTSFRVTRGGSWLDSSHGVRAANRLSLYPSFNKDLYGFRCSLSLP
jgi:formylglycine-generating enzyme required for sulfatase activity